MLSEMPQTKKPKYDRASHVQMKWFVEFMNRTPDLWSGKKNVNVSKELWEEVAVNLNALRGPSRTSQKWKESLSNWKHQWLSRGRKSRASQMATRSPAFLSNENSSDIFSATAVTNWLNDTKLNQKNETDELMPYYEYHSSDTEKHREANLLTPLAHVHKSHSSEVSEGSEACSSRSSCKNQTSESKKCKYERATHDQLKWYLSFIKRTPEILIRKKNVKENEELWEQVAANINAIRGPKRTTEKWKDSLKNWKHQVVSRVRRARTLQQVTGGELSMERVTELDLEAFDVFNAIAVKGFLNDGEFCDKNKTEQVMLDEEEQNSFIIEHNDEKNLLSPQLRTDAHSPADPKILTVETMFAAMEETKRRHDDTIKTMLQNQQQLISQHQQLVDVIKGLAQSNAELSKKTIEAVETLTRTCIRLPPP